jgi:hypothetical protein
MPDQRTEIGARPSFSEEKAARRRLFLRQRNDAGYSLDLGSGGGTKVFCFFSSEKKDFLRETPHPGPPHKEGEVADLSL